jgi:hypothetical protein
MTNRKLKERMEVVAGIDEERLARVGVVCEEDDEKGVEKTDDSDEFNLDIKNSKKVMNRDPYGCVKDSSVGILLKSGSGRGSRLHVSAGNTKRRKDAMEEAEGYKRPAYNRSNTGAEAKLLKVTAV